MAAYQDNLAQSFGNMGLGPNSGQYPPPQQGYQGQQYSSPPPQGQYGSPPPAPAYQPPQDKPPIPREWRPFWDHQHQRWYYANENTRETQWEAPGYYQPQPSGGDGRGYNAPPGPPPGQYNSPQYGAPPDPPPGKNKKSSGGMGTAGGLALGAAAGLAAGVGGSYLFHKAEDAIEDRVDRFEDRVDRIEDRFDDRVDYVEDEIEDRVHRDEERFHRAEDGFVDGWEGAAVPAVLPAHDIDGRSVSSSDREEVEEARERYEEALRDAESSSASSSDREELEEAREEYEEEYEEAYGGGDDYDDDY